MLPEDQFAFLFLDEVFQGSTAILNPLLTILNERTFRRGHTRLDCTLRACVGASNALPADESLAAFAAREGRGRSGRDGAGDPLPRSGLALSPFRSSGGLCSPFTGPELYQHLRSLYRRP